MSTLLLLEAAWLPTGWGSKINIRCFLLLLEGYNPLDHFRNALPFFRIYFEQFCPVEGVLYLPNRGSLRRVVVAFPW